jgi:hypothetical protein
MKNVMNKKKKEKRNKCALALNALTLASFLSFPGPSAKAEFADEKLKTSVVSLLNRLKMARSYRIAERSNKPELETAKGGRGDKRPKFNEKKLRTLCANIGATLFTNQNRITAPPKMDRWARGDGKTQVQEVMMRQFPACKVGADWNHLHGTTSDQFFGRVLTRDDHFMSIRQGVIFLTTDGYLFIRLYMGDFCPVHKEATPIEILEEAENKSSATLLMIDGWLVLVEMEKPNLFVLGYESIDSFRSQSLFADEVQRIALMRNWYPQDLPHADEQMLVIFIPPFSPLVKPISSEMNKPRYQPEEQKNQKSAGASLYSDAPTCFLYFKD